MSEAEFRAKRRQKFLTEKYYRLNQVDVARSISNTLVAVEEESRSESPSHDGVFKNKLRLLRLHYTAGEPIDALRPLYADVMHWFAEWHRAHEAYRASIAHEDGEDLRIDVTPLEFNDLFHFQLAVEVISLGVLLGEGERVREAGRWLRFERERGDMLVEYLLGAATSQDELIDCDEFFHVKPYDPLLDAVYTADTPDESAAFVKKYLEGWYKAFDGVPWHDGHLVQTHEYSNYEGYWSFEAAAVCVIHGIDDTSFRDHILYPKDLADWARSHKVLDLVKPKAGAGALVLRVDAGQACPQTGYWFTTAKKGSRKAFKAGEKMPEIKDSPWGATIWYWDEKQ
jgi:Domain of unknown function (DUF1911)